MESKILIEVDLGKKGVEKCDVIVYLDGRSIEDHWEIGYDDLPMIADKLREKYPDANIETCCLGEDCCGRSHAWNIDI